jgi:TonB-dependent starch-binding outer membrane protein SusC
MKRKKLLTLLFACLFCTAMLAQTSTLSGKIMSGGEPVIGATVKLVETNKGAVSDADGAFTIKDLSTGSVMVSITSVGYTESTQTVVIKAGANTLNVEMESSGKFLDEVVVTGLSINAKQKELGTSRASVSGKTLQSMPAPTIETALTGRLPGVEAYSTDGAPGGGFRFRIRGGNSLLGASEPLVIIDGMIMDNSNRNNTTGATGNTGSASFGMNNGTRGLAMLNPADIESMEILKGAAAASLYGSRASSGVIVVTTKSGGKGKMSVNYGVDFGTLHLSRPIQNYKTDWTNAEIDEWVALQNGRLAAASRITAAEQTQYKLNPMKDWSLEPFRVGTMQRHTINVQGGNRKLGYYLTLNSQNTQGHIKGADFRTNGGRLSISSNPFKGLKIRLNGAMNNDFRSILPGGTPGFFIPNRWTVAAIQTPFMRGDDQRAAFVGGIFGIRNPDEYARIQKRMKVNRYQLSGNINYAITPNLSVDINAGYDDSHIDGRTIYPQGAIPSPALFPAGRLDYDAEDLIQFTLTTGLNHVWKINKKLYLKSAVGTQYDENERFYYYRRFQTYTPTRGNDLDTAAYTTQFPGSVLNFNPIVRTLGVYVNETFGIGEKLFLNIGGRFDRATAFVERFFFYPRASLSYQLTPTIRFRGAYGSSGIQPPPYQINLAYQFEAAGFNGSGGGYRPSNPGNKNLTPEQQTEIEFGADASFFNNRVNVELTYYNKQFKDMLFNASVAPDINNGFTRFVRNVATMYNRGFEFSVNTAVVRTKDLEWNVGVNGFTLENKITKLNDPVRPEAAGPNNIVQLRPDYSISSVFGGLVSSVFTDRVNNYIGPTIPGFEGNVITNLSYKGFNLQAMLGGKTGHYRYNLTERDLADPTVRMHKEYWNLPADQALTRFNDLSQWVQKADFLKLRQLGLSYSYVKPADLTGFVKNVTVSIVGANLITWSTYKGGYDIEAETSGSSAGNAWVRGIDSWEAGPPRTWTVSFNIGF